MSTAPDPAVAAVAAEGDTRTRLLRAAAHLFARKGIEGVKIHEIHALAGQRNESAVHYHFGNRWKLVGAILEESNLAAAEALDISTADLVDVDEVVEVLVRHLATGLASPEGRDWIRIVSELANRSFTEDRTPGFGGHFRGVVGLLQPLP